MFKNKIIQHHETIQNRAKYVISILQHEALDFNNHAHPLMLLHENFSLTVDQPTLTTLAGLDEVTKSDLFEKLKKALAQNEPGNIQQLQQTLAQDKIVIKTNQQTITELRSQSGNYFDFTGLHNSEYTIFISHGWRCLEDVVSKIDTTQEIKDLLSDPRAIFAISQNRNELLNLLIQTTSDSSQFREIHFDFETKTVKLLKFAPPPLRLQPVNRAFGSLKSE